MGSQRSESATLATGLVRPAAPGPAYDGPMSDFIRVDFSRPIPLFPLPDTVLLPHAVQPLHIFEPRYRQMVRHSLKGSRQIAMACFVPCDFRDYVDESPPLRPVVCVGQILQHQTLPDGRHNILLHGVCRARIDELIEPDEEHAYRQGQLAPIETEEALEHDLPEIREQLRDLLTNPRLRRMRAAKDVSEWFDREDVSTPALLELIGSVLLSDCELKYRLLSEPSVSRRAELIRAELAHLDRVVGLADRQDHRAWPKGMSWN